MTWDDVNKIDRIRHAHAQKHVSSGSCGINLRVNVSKDFFNMGHALSQKIMRWQVNYIGMSVRVAFNRVGC